MIRVRVNGQERTLPDGTTVAGLVEDLGLPADGIAVAIGRDVVPRSHHRQRRLQDGDVVEVIRAVGGG